MSKLLAPFTWTWNAVDDWKTLLTLIVWFAYLALCEFVWGVEPDETFILWLKGAFGGSLAHKVVKVKRATVPPKP